MVFHKIKKYFEVKRNTKAFRKKMDENEKITVSLARGFRPQTKPGELLPPWLKYPDLCAFHIGWRMGPGEDYLIEFRDYWMTLSQEEKIDYFRRYDLGPKWPDRQEWYSNWVEIDEGFENET